jgi:hypothetical protein
MIFVFLKARNNYSEKEETDYAFSKTSFYGLTVVLNGHVYVR